MLNVPQTKLISLTDLGGDAPHHGGHLGCGGVVHGGLGHNATRIDHYHASNTFVVLKTLQRFF